MYTQCFKQVKHSETVVENSRYYACQIIWLDLVDVSNRLR